MNASRKASAVILFLLHGGLGNAAAADPPEDAARGVRPDDLIRLVDIGPVAVSPDGHAIAFETRRADLVTNSTVIRWHILELDDIDWRGAGRHRPAADINAGDGGAPINEPFRGHPTGFTLPQLPQWTPDSRWIAYRLNGAAPSSNETRIQIWRTSREGARTQQLTHAAADVDTFVWSKDGTRLIYATSSARAEYERFMSEEGDRGYLYDERFSPTFGREPIFDPPPRSPRNYWVHELAPSAERHASPNEQAELEPHVRDFAWSDEGVNALLKDMRPDLSFGVNPPLTVAGCTAPQCVGYFNGIWRSAGGKIVFLRWTNSRNYGALGLYSWFPGQTKVKEILRTDDLLDSCSLLARQTLRGQLLCAHESATTPRKLVIIDLASGAQRTLYDPNPAFQYIKFGAVTPLTWHDANGIEGFGHLVLPIGESRSDNARNPRHPLIIVQYRSRGFLRGGVGDEFPIHAFSAQGFAVLSFQRPYDWELQGRVRSHLELENLGYIGQRERRRILSVLLAGIDALVARGVIDPQRIGITGLSDGGETVGFALIHAPDRFAAAAASWTVYSPSSWYLLGPKTQSLFNGFGLGFPRGAAAEQWQQLSLALNAERVQTPLLLQVSDQELLPELETIAALQHHRKPVELYVFPDEYHVKLQPRHRHAIYRRNVQWFQFWLQGKEMDDPLDAGQYLRWRALRELQPNSTKPERDLRRETLQ